MRIPYDMFDYEAHGLAAKNAHVLERVYHKGNRHTWDGKEVLASLVAEHGHPTLSPENRDALGRVFSLIMWGELAAWRISAQLAAEIEPLEAKMAATSQAFDEARHFYVMHDYLELLGGLPERLPKGAERLLTEIMATDCLAKKLLGMQLMVEPVALALFHVVRELELEPVLTHLLPYYERDEARHVALGLQYLPALLANMSRTERMGLWAFQAKLLTYEVHTNRELMADLATLGLDPRIMVDAGKSRQMKALEMVLDSLGTENRTASNVLNRYVDTLIELTIPADLGGSLETRLKRAWTTLKTGNPLPDVELVPTITDEQTPLVKATREAA